MDNIEIAKLIYDFKNQGSYIWIDGDNLQLLVSDTLKTLDLKNLISNFKPQIFTFLKYNSIYSKEDFQKKKIFSIDCEKLELSFAQQRLWFIEQFEEGTFAYHVPILYELAVTVDTTSLQKAVAEIVKRHEILRTTIDNEDEEHQLLQKVNFNPLTIDEMELLANPDYKNLIAADINKPFKLREEYPIRAKLYILKDKGGRQLKRFLLIIIHHIACDGWSVDVFDRELHKFCALYEDESAGNVAAKLDIQYKDYGTWQKHYLSSDVITSQVSYWKKKLADFQPLNLPIDSTRPSKTDYHGEYFYFSINSQISSDLRSLVSRLGVTLHSVMLGAFSILLGRYSNQNDIVIGSPVANRQHRQTESLIGFFVNMLVNRIELINSETFEELVKRIYLDQIEFQLNQDIPFDKLVEELEIERDPSKHPIFQVLLGVQSFGNQDQTEGLERKFLRRLPVEEFYKVERFDMTMLIDDSRSELQFQFSYLRNLFNTDTIERLVHNFKHLLFLLSRFSDKAYSELNLLTDAESDKIFGQWNATDIQFPDKHTYHELFQKQVEKTPEKTAVSCDGRSLTYKELNNRSEQLAHVLIKRYRERWGKKLQPDTLISIYLSRDIEMAIAILAVFKAGAAYVPIDPTYPADRIDFIIEDSKSEFVFTRRGEINVERLPEDKAIYIDSMPDIASDSCLDYSGGSVNNLAYIIYTSGSTGRPKGAMIEHKGMLNHLFSKIDLLHLNEESIVVQNASQCFDISVWQFLAVLLRGGKVVIYTEELILNPAKLLEQVNVDHVTVLEVVPSYLSALLDVIEEDKKVHLARLDFLIVTGEELKSDLVKRWFNNYPAIPLVNAYGPTEAADDITHHVMTQYSGEKLIPVGKPIQNLKIYIVNELMHPQPIGVIGEICVSGVGVGRGYLNNESKTKEVFTVDPFRPEEKVRLYKTGDLGKWLPDGNIQYLGRKDEQVKIRGFRIETGEIEHAIMAIPDVLQSCVVVYESNNTKHLVGYYSSTTNNLTSDIIINRLSSTIPLYMIPDILIAIDKFPLTSNGKLDKKALPAPQLSVFSESCVAPASESEILVSDIWKTILRKDKVGVTDDFFRIGGNSILAIQVSHKMSKALDAEIKVADIFRWKTISSLLKIVDLAKSQNDQVEWEV